MITLRQQIAQMLIMGFDGTAIHDQSLVKHWITSEGLGGVILFDYDLPRERQGKNIVDLTQVQQLTAELTALAERSTAIPHDMPLFIAVDYEGGAVDRLKGLFKDAPSMTPKAYAFLNEEEQRAEAQKMANHLKTLGFNLNFAPVLDLNLNENQGIIGKLSRSYSDDPLTVATVAGRFVDVLVDSGIVCCYKHFPGHGSATGDTHEGFVDVTETFHQDELRPYELLLQNKACPVMIMTAHVVNRQLDESGLPATLSSTILTGLLRNKMGFDGVIVSDDLQMQAITQHYSLEESLKLTINAGADMLIFGNQLGCHRPTDLIDIIENLVLQKAITPARIWEAYQRIRCLKACTFACI